ncbi:MAG: integrin alpha [Candidatus Midichloria sp.]|nr:integrin alpha [Candidatus Midichloria sp.]
MKRILYYLFYVIIPFQLNYSNGFINGIHNWNFAGYSVASAGDLNGDRQDDLIIGATWVDLNAGQAYVILDPFSPY